MKISLILSTYNWVEALTLCLRSALDQSRLPDEILVADDGSRDETRQRVEAIARTASVPVRHIWHEDDGFRASVIRNRAIAAATGDYLIQIDGDIILHRRFIEDHARMAERGYFVVGSRVMLGERLSAGLLSGAVKGFGLCSADLKNRLNGIRCPLLTALFRTRKAHARGCNMAFWRDDAVAVNGYDERMTGWGYEDNEFAARLSNNGIGQHALKFGGIGYHLHHPFRSRSRENINFEIWQTTLRNRVLRCERGIDAYL